MADLVVIALLHLEKRVENYVDANNFKAKEDVKSLL
jgi:hypothetical protein